MCSPPAFPISLLLFLLLLCQQGIVALSYICTDHTDHAGWLVKARLIKIKCSMSNCLMCTSFFSSTPASLVAHTMDDESSQIIIFRSSCSLCTSSFSSSSASLTSCSPGSSSLSPYGWLLNRGSCHSLSLAGLS